MPCSLSSRISHAFAGSHLIDGDVFADVTQELQQRDRLGPVPVVDQHPTFGIAEVDDPAQLLLDRCHVGAQRLVVEQIALLGTPAGIADHAGRSAGERDRLVPGVLEPTQHDQTDQVADVQTVGGGVAPVVDAD